MPVAATYCRGQLGLHAPLVQVEVNLGSGLPMFSNGQAVLFLTMLIQLNNNFSSVKWSYT